MSFKIVELVMLSGITLYRVVDQEGYRHATFDKRAEAESFIRAATRASGWWARLTAAINL